MTLGSYVFITYIIYHLGLETTMELKVVMLITLIYNWLWILTGMSVSVLNYVL